MTNNTNKTKNLYLIVGKSGCGKTTLAEGLVELGYSLAKSYTTRNKRTSDEDTYYFVSEEEFETIPNKLAVGCYAGNFYAISHDILDKSDIYIVEPSGIEDVKAAYKDSDRNVYIIYVLMNQERRLEFLISRCKQEGKTLSAAVDFCKNRMLADEKLFNSILDTVDYVVVNWSTKEELVKNALYFINHCEAGNYPFND
jgi:guanylate kinase